MVKPWKKLTELNKTFKGDNKNELAVKKDHTGF